MADDDFQLPRSSGVSNPFESPPPPAPAKASAAQQAAAPATASEPRSDDTSVKVAAPAGANAAANATRDWLKGVRKFYYALMAMLAAATPSAMFMTMLPSIFMSIILIYVNTGLSWFLAEYLSKAYPNSASATQIRDANMGAFNSVANVLTTYLGWMAGVTYATGVTGVISIWRQWPGVLSICAWLVLVIGHFLLVATVLVLVASSSAFAYISLPTILYNAFLTISMAFLVPACVVFSVSASVMSSRREIMSG